VTVTELTQGSVVAERFRLVKRLGQGGFATVWLADDSGSSPMRTVALKIMHTRSRVHRELADRFLQEARMLIGLDHPGVARAYHVHEDEHFLCYAMEYVEGHTLRDEMGRRAREGRVFALPEVASIASSLGRTLDYAHQRKLVHRDLKPANLIVVSAMEDQGPARYCLKLVDFGIAKDLTVEADGATTAGRTLGTYSYMTPEQTRSAAVSARTDVFAMAGVLFEVITLKRAWLRDESGFPQPYGGALVFDGPNMPGAIFDRLSRGPRPSIAACGSRLPAEVVSFLDRALGRAFAVDPADRQASAGALALEIVEALHIATSVDHLVTLRDTPLDEIEPAVTRPAPVVSAARPDDGGWPSGPVPVVTRKPVTKADLKPPPMADWMVIPQPFSRSDALLTGYAIGEHSAVPPAFPEARAAVSIVNEAERPRPPDPASVIDVPVPKPALGTGFAIAKRTETQLKPFTDFDRHIRPRFEVVRACLHRDGVRERGVLPPSTWRRSPCRRARARRARVVRDCFHRARRSWRTSRSKAARRADESSDERRPDLSRRWPGRGPRLHAFDGRARCPIGCAGRCATLASPSEDVAAVAPRVDAL